jgi:hypothetical protein
MARKTQTKKSKPQKKANLNPDASLRKRLVELLKGGEAHVKLLDAVANFPPEKRGIAPNGLQHTGWQLLHHIRIALWDMVQFSRDATHISPEFPSGYWPKTSAPPDNAAWDKSVRSIQKDMQVMIKLISDPRTDLHAPFPWGDGQSLLRESLLIADHNAYHTAQIVDVRRALGIWNQ